MSKKKENDIEDAVKELKKTADKAKEQYSTEEISIKVYIGYVLKVVAAIAISYWWTLIMLLIVSFVSLGYLHFSFDKMLVYSGIVAGIVGVCVTIATIIKIRKK